MGGAVDDGGGGELDVFDAGRCGGGGYELGVAVGRRFGEAIRRRMSGDAVLRRRLLPFASTAPGRALVDALRDANRARKELLPFITEEEDQHHHREDEAAAVAADADDDCSDVLIVGESAAIAAHNEDANVALLGHTYVVKATSPDGSSSFTAYTYAGELPTCAFGFNSNGVRVSSPAMSVGHSYNLMDVRRRRIVNVETASGNRFSVREAAAAPFFHANMYRHLQVNQVQDENSMSRERRAAELSPDTKEKALSLLGDTADDKYPIYMTGPTLYTLCTVLVDLDEATMTIYKGNPKNRDAVRVFRML
uniref:Peptidase C45 hydrolase domain-containing protein n=1 Tax=Oryza glaberrima TaxID=4538 RepID=I1NLD6_ORYGL